MSSKTRVQIIMAMAMIDQIHKLFAGRDPELIGAVLADLLATWLAGHIVEGDQKATDNYRRETLKFHIEQVRKLIPINEREILQREAEAGKRQKMPRSKRRTP